MIDHRGSGGGPGRASANVRARFAAHLDVDEAVCVDHEVPKRVERDTSASRSATAIITTSEFGSADLWDAMHTNIFPCTFRAGWPHAVVTSTSGRARPMASTAANVYPRRVSPSPSRADEAGLLGIRRPPESKPDQGPQPSADRRPNDVFTKITPRWAPSDEPSARERLIVPAAFPATEHERLSDSANGMAASGDSLT